MPVLGCDFLGDAEWFDMLEGKGFLPAATLTLGSPLIHPQSAWQSPPKMSDKERKETERSRELSRYDLRCIQRRRKADHQTFRLSSVRLDDPPIRDRTTACTDTLVLPQTNSALRNISVTENGLMAVVLPT